MNIFYKVEDVDKLLDRAIDAVDADINVAFSSDNIEGMNTLLEVSKALLAFKLKLFDLRRYSENNKK